MKKSVSILLTLALVFGAFGTLFATSVSAATTYKVLDNIQYFKVNGRSIEKNQLDQAGSSLEWNANCSGDVKVTVKVENAWNGNNYFTAFVDGVRVEERFECANGGRGVFTIATGLASGNHTFKFARQTQPADGLDTVDSVNFTGTFNPAPADKNALIEVIGDSITCGDGAYQTGGIAPIHSDATLSYAYLTADTLGTDLSVVAQGGAGVVLNYSVNLKDMYPSTSYYRNKSVLYTPTRKANVVVINLMTNDINRFGSLSVAERDSTLVTLKANAKTLLNQVIANNGNVPIVWCYGMMVSPSKTFGDSKNTTIPMVINELKQTYSNLYSLELPYNTSGGAGHPNAEGQANAAKVLSQYIDSQGWVKGSPKTKGDVNGDGKVNTLDLQALLKIVSAGKGGDLETCDMNNDKKIDVLDIKALLFKLL